LIVATRLHDTTSITQSGGGSTAVDSYDIFNTTGAPVSVADTYEETLLDALQLPRRGSPHPELGSTLKAQSILRTTRGRGVLYQVTYAVPSLVEFRIPPDKLLPGYRSIELTSRPKIVEFPIFQLQKISVPTDGAPVDPQYAWAQLDNTFSVEITEEVLTIVLSKTYLTDLTLEDQIRIFASARAQLNKIHLIGGEKYLFKGLQDFRQRTDDIGEEPARAEVRYEWVYDPGVRNTLGIAPRDGLIIRGQLVGDLQFLDTAFIAQSKEFIIEPYQRVDWFPSREDSFDPPLVVFSSLYTEDLEPQAWQSLPGIGS
jgi:hypothetical protein